MESTTTTQDDENQGSDQSAFPHANDNRDARTEYRFQYNEAVKDPAAPRRDLFAEFMVERYGHPSNVRDQDIEKWAHRFRDARHWSKADAEAQLALAKTLLREIDGTAPAIKPSVMDKALSDGYCLEHGDRNCGRCADDTREVHS